MELFRVECQDVQQETIRALAHYHGFMPRHITEPSVSLTHWHPGYMKGRDQSEM